MNFPTSPSRLPSAISFFHLYYRGLKDQLCRLTSTQNGTSPYAQQQESSQQASPPPPLIWRTTVMLQRPTPVCTGILVHPIPEPNFLTGRILSLFPLAFHFLYQSVPPALTCASRQVCARERQCPFGSVVAWSSHDGHYSRMTRRRQVMRHEQSVERVNRDLEAQNQRASEAIQAMKQREEYASAEHVQKMRQLQVGVHLSGCS